MLEARTVWQGEVPTGCVGNTVRCIGEGMERRMGKVSRTVVYNLGREQNFKLEARTG